MTSLDLLLDLASDLSLARKRRTDAKKTGSLYHISDIDRCPWVIADELDLDGCRPSCPWTS